MKLKKRNSFSLLLGIALIGVTVPRTALADEIWVTPTEAQAQGSKSSKSNKSNKSNDNWPVTDGDDTHFSFSAPDDMEDFVAAKIVVIGTKSKNIEYDLNLSISQNGLRHDDYTDDTFQNQPATLFEDELLEIDVSLPYLGGHTFPRGGLHRLAFQRRSNRGCSSPWFALPIMMVVEHKARVDRQDRQDRQDRAGHKA